MRNEQSNDDEIEKEQKIFCWKCNTPNCGKTAVTESEDIKPPGITEPGTEPGPCIETKIDNVRQGAVTARHKWIPISQSLPEATKQKS
jgi:hypothetical protein